MALQAWIVVFSSADPADHEKVLPSKEEILEACKEYLDIPDDNVVVDMWPVEIESVSFSETQCRKCGAEVEEGNLFCDDCRSEIAQGAGS